MTETNRVEITFLFTPIPNGIIYNNRLRLSILVSPSINMRTVNTLGNINSFLNMSVPFYSSSAAKLHNALLDWPSILPKLGIKITLNNTESKCITISQNADSTYWSRIFTSEMLVKPHTVENLTGLTMSTYDTPAVTKAVQEIFAAINLDDLNDKNAVLERLQNLSKKNRYSARNLDKVDNGDKPSIETDVMTGFETFHNRKNRGLDKSGDDTSQYTSESKNKQPVSYSQGGSPLAYESIIDFHEIVTHLASYPVLMEALGLKIDIEFSLSNVPPSGIMKVEFENLNSSQFLYSEQNSTELLVSVISSKVTYEIDEIRGKHFFRSSSNPDNQLICNNMLILNNPLSLYSKPLQVDVDAAAKRILQVAEQLEQTPEDVKARALADILPNLISGDIGLAWKRPTYNLDKQLKRSSYIAEDIAMQPSCERKTALYSEDLIRGYRVDVYDTITDHWHSLCYRWGEYLLYGDGNYPRELPIVNNGYHKDEGMISEVVGSMIDDDIDEIILPESFTQYPNFSDEPILDRTGNQEIKSFIPLDTNSNCSNDEEGGVCLYVSDMVFRWDGWSLSVPMPNVTQNIGFTNQLYKVSLAPVPGTLPKLRFGRTYKFRVRVVDAAGNSLSLQEANNIYDLKHQSDELTFKRFEPLAPPYSFNNIKIPKGFIDTNVHIVLRSSKDTTPAVFSKNDDNAYIKQQGSEANRYVGPPRVSQQLAERHGKFDEDDGSVTRNFAQIQENTSPFDPLNPTIPYWPDPLARSLIIKFGNHEAKKLDFLDIDNEWPCVKPAKLSVIEGNTEEISIDALNRLITITLPQAHTSSITVCSSLSDAGYLDQLGIWEWLEGNLDRDPQKALNGEYSFITPSMTIIATHTVERPLEYAIPSPDFDKIVAERNEGDSWIDFKPAALTYHPKSTVSVDVVAEWQECIDDLEADGPELTKQRDILTNISLSPTDASKQELKLFHRFPDTKYRNITYSTIALSRFKKYFPQNDKRVFTLEYKKSRVVRSTMRPDAPAIAYMMVSYRWPKKRQLDREGNWVRVYFKRPWYSSGNGEKLAVILPNANSDPESNPYSDWGADPIFNEKGIEEKLSFDNFRNRQPTEIIELTDCILDHQRQTAIEAVLYKPEYETNRQLWYVDLHIPLIYQPESQQDLIYSPFIRLAFARYQEHSLKNLELSTIVRSDFIRMENDRYAAYSYNANKAVITVSVNGPVPTAFSVSQNEVIVIARVDGDLNIYNKSKVLTLIKQDVAWSGDLEKIPENSLINISIHEYEFYSDTNVTKKRLVYAFDFVVDTAKQA